MSWTLEEMTQAAIEAPMTRDGLRADTQVFERPGWWQTLTPSSFGSALNEVTFSQVEAEDADRLIEETIALYRAHGFPTKWCVGPWTRPKGFGDRLTKRGFRSWAVRGMACETNASVSDDIDGIEVMTKSNADDFTRAFIEGWGVPKTQQDAVTQHHLGLRNAHFFLLRVKGEVAGTTALLMRDRYAYLMGAQILERYRGRGMYRRLIEARLRFLKKAGITLAVTHARESSSAPMLEHLGFTTVFRSRCYLLDLAD